VHEHRGGVYSAETRAKVAQPAAGGSCYRRSRVGLRRQAGLVLCAVCLAASACYEMQPRRIAVNTPPRDGTCAEAVASVFTAYGYVPVASHAGPPLLFTPRAATFDSTTNHLGWAIGVWMDDPGDSSEGCQLELEAVSNDGDCTESTAQCQGSSPTFAGQTTMPEVSGHPGYGPNVAHAEPSCYTRLQLGCPFTPVRGASYDAAVDDIARHLRVVLRTRATVNQVEK
jgi:hypothetical protein